MIAKNYHGSAKIFLPLFFLLVIHCGGSGDTETTSPDSNAKTVATCSTDSSDPVGAFVAEFDANAKEMLDQAVDRYKTLIEDHPNQFLWGTENVELYDFETEVYNRSVIFARAFIDQLDETVREKFAYQNAEALFGPGVGEISD